MLETYPNLVCSLQEGIPDNTDEFVDFRSRVSELIKDVVFITDSSCCFTQVMSLHLLMSSINSEVTTAYVLNN